MKKDFTDIVSPISFTLSVLVLGILFLPGLSWLLHFFYDGSTFFSVLLVKEILSIGFVTILIYLCLRYYVNQSVETVSKELQSIVKNMYNLVFKVRRTRDGEFYITFSEGKIADEYKRTTKELYGKTLREIIDPKCEEKVISYYQRAFSGEHVSYEYEIGKRTLYTALSPVEEYGRVVAVIGSSSDITELKEMEKEIHEYNHKISTILESITEGFFALDKQGRITYINARALHLLNLNKMDVLNQSYAKVFPPEFYAMCREQVEAACHSQIPYRFETTDKERQFEVRVYPSPSAMSVYFDDVTEARQAEELLRKSERLSTVGQLAAGLAHEIKNPLTSLRGFVQILKSSKAEEIKQDYLKIMLDEIDQIDFIMSEFLILAKPQAITVQENNLERLIEHTLLFLQPIIIQHDININIIVDPFLPLIECEENQLKQVFMHLIKNSIEAMPNGGIIEIELKKEDQQHISIRISDEGNGISSDRLSRLGEPFYTTKEKGTGLGLMISYKIIENHKGRISVRSEEGKGTTIEIFLPCYSEVGTYDTIHSGTQLNKV